MWVLRRKQQCFVGLWAFRSKSAYHKTKMRVFNLKVHSAKSPCIHTLKGLTSCFYQIRSSETVWYEPVEYPSYQLLQLIGASLFCFGGIGIVLCFVSVSLKHLHLQKEIIEQQHFKVTLHLLIENSTSHNANGC